MVEVKASELIGAALDWAVAQCARMTACTTLIRNNPLRIVELCDDGIVRKYAPSTDWSQGGPLIEKYGINVMTCNNGSWMAKIWEAGRQVCMTRHESSALIAACRAIVAAKLGDTVQVPAELITNG